MTREEIIKRAINISASSKAEDYIKFVIELAEFGSSEKPNNHSEQIVCPKCGAIQTAKVEHTVPFYSYVHTCEKCGYTILESEWEHPNTPEGLDEAACEYVTQKRNNWLGDDAWEFIFHAFKAGAEWRDRMLNWARDLVQAGIDKPEEAVNILKRLKELI